MCSPRGHLGREWTACEGHVLYAHPGHQRTQGPVEQPSAPFGRTGRHPHCPHSPSRCHLRDFPAALPRWKLPHAKWGYAIVGPALGETPIGLALVKVPIDPAPMWPDFATVGPGQARLARETLLVSNAVRATVACAQME